MQTLPITSQSVNLYYRNAEKGDTLKLQAICDSWTDKVLVEGEPFAPDYIANCIENGDLPPIENASPENYSIKAICSKENDEIIGFFEIYHGYPSPDVLWIGLFVIDSRMQKSGYGSEIVGLLSRQAKKSGFAALGLGVYLKNRKGLGFWKKNGFDKVIGISDSEEYAADEFPIIKLKKILLLSKHQL